MRRPQLRDQMIENALARAEAWLRQFERFPEMQETAEAIAKLLAGARRQIQKAS